ncbi:hypothetical protein N9089_00570 [Crocinitomicaceae bacterium]|nr:hypothetical protein [Crocinitomicaceae bacterium]
MMRLIMVLCAVFLLGNVQAQKKKDQTPLDLKNVVIIGQMDDPSDRYSVEINMTELFSTNGVKSKASLNLMKQGADSEILASDSLKSLLQKEGFDTYLLITVRGYDKRFKISDANDDFKTSLSRGNLFSIYQEGVVSVSFEFKFFRNGELVRDEVIKCGNAGSREKVLSKLRKKVRKRLVKDWK